MPVQESKAETDRVGQCVEWKVVPDDDVMAEAMALEIDATVRGFMDPEATARAAAFAKD